MQNCMRAIIMRLPCGWLLVQPKNASHLYSKYSQSCSACCWLISLCVSPLKNVINVCEFYKAVGFIRCFCSNIDCTLTTFIPCFSLPPSAPFLPFYKPSSFYFYGFFVCIHITLLHILQKVQSFWAWLTSLP